MSKTILQVPMDIDLRNNAEKAALAAGFSSVQEVVRVFLNKLANQKVGIGFYEQDVMMSKQSEKRYIAMVNDTRNKKNLVKLNSVDDLMSVLE